MSKSIHRSTVCEYIQTPVDFYKAILSKLLVAQRKRKLNNKGFVLTGGLLCAITISTITTFIFEEYTVKVSYAGTASLFLPRAWFF